MATRMILVDDTGGSYCCGEYSIYVEDASALSDHYPLQASHTLSKRDIHWKHSLPFVSLHYTSGTSTLRSLHLRSAAMRFLSIANSLLALAASSAASQLPPDHILWGEKGSAGNHMVRRQATTTTASASTSTRVADAACSNGPFTRSCWAPGYSIYSDFDAKWPNTGKTVYVSTACSASDNFTGR